MDCERQRWIPARERPRARPALLCLATPQAGLRITMPTSDEFHDWLVAVAEHGDRQAFAALFKHFAPRVKSFLVRAGASPEVAEELTQETMVLVWRKAASFDPARAGVSTWIFTIARHQRIDHLRRSGPMPIETAAEDDPSYAEPSADPALAPDARHHSAERERGVRRALAQLPPDQARVLRLSFFGEHAHARIAEELGVPLGTVKSRIRLAVGQLRRLLERFEDDE
jgi:RNA polymerase sigma factor (sigma-70 family)